jgi:predicted ester cyclase
MSTEENKAILRESYEVIFDQHRIDRADEFYSVRYRERGANSKSTGLNGAQKRWTAAATDIPDLHVTIEELVAEGDKVAVAWAAEATHRAMPDDLASNRKVRRFRGLALYRLADGKIAELVAGRSPLSSAAPGGLRTTGSTERSRALLSEVTRLVPEIGLLDRPRMFDFEDALGTGRRQVIAGAERTYPGVGQITVHIAVSPPGEGRLPCTGEAGNEPCTRIEKLPDGSTAYLRTYTVPATVGHAYECGLVRRDGTVVSVSSAAYRPEGAKMPDAPLSLDRVLEIARLITTTP